MNILNLTPTIFSSNSVFGGGEKYVEYFQKALEVSLREQNRTGKVDIGYPTNLVVEQLNLPPKTLLFYTSTNEPEDFDRDLFISIISEYDVIVVHQCLSKFGMRAAALAKIINKKVIGFDHGGGEDSGFIWQHDTPLFFDAFIAQSKYAKHGFDNFQNRVEVVLGPIPVDQNKSTFDNGKSEKTILSIGRVLPHKGFEQIIKNMTKDSSLTIVGKAYDPSYLDYLKKCMKKYKANVTFKHDVENFEMKKVIENASLYVQPSKNRDYRNNFIRKPELLSLASLEAMSNGIPTLVSNVGALPELASIPGCVMFESEVELRNLLHSKVMFSQDKASKEEMIRYVEENYGTRQFGLRMLSIFDTLVPQS